MLISCVSCYIKSEGQIQSLEQHTVRKKEDISPTANFQDESDIAVCGVHSSGAATANEDFNSAD